MSFAALSLAPFNRLWRFLLTGFSFDNLPTILGLFKHLLSWLKFNQPQGLYEILEYDTTLELKDRRGKTAVFTKRQKIKFLQDYTNTFQDYAWGDGEIFADYRCSPGTVVDRYQEGDRYNILISLRETKHSGDVEEFYIQRIAKDGFTKPDESLQTEIRHRTKRLRVKIIFPRSRRCQRAMLLQRIRRKTLELGPDHFTTLPDGRQLLTWEATKIKQFEIYTISWHW